MRTSPLYPSNTLGSQSRCARTPHCQQDFSIGWQYTQRSSTHSSTWKPKDYSSKQTGKSSLNAAKILKKSLKLQRRWMPRTHLPLALYIGSDLSQRPTCTCRLQRWSIWTSQSIRARMVQDAKVKSSGSNRESPPKNLQPSYTKNLVASMPLQRSIMKTKTGSP